MADAEGGNLDERAAEILLRTNGNALMVRALIESDQDDSSKNGGMLPENVMRLVGLYLSKLSPDQLDIVSYAAVLGSEYSISKLLRIVDPTPVGEVMGALDAAVQCGLMQPISGESDVYRFRHELVRETVMDELDLSKRVELHADCATALEKLREEGEKIPAFELLHHFSKSEIVHGERKVATYALEAGREALKNEDCEAVVRILEPRARSIASKHPDLGALMHAVLAPAYKLVKGLRPVYESQRIAFELAVGTGNADTIRALIEEFTLPRELDEETTSLAHQAIQILENDSHEDDRKLIRRLDVTFALKNIQDSGWTDNAADARTLKLAREAADEDDLEFALDILQVRVLLCRLASRHDDVLKEIQRIRELCADRKDETYKLIWVFGEIDALKHSCRFDEVSELIARIEPIALRNIRLWPAKEFFRACGCWYVETANWKEFKQTLEVIRPMQKSYPAAILPGINGLVELDRLEEAREFFFKPNSPPLRWDFDVYLPTYLIRTGIRSIGDMIDLDPKLLAEAPQDHPQVRSLIAILRSLRAWLDGDLDKLRTFAQDIDPEPLPEGYETAGFLKQISGEHDAAIELYTQGLEKAEHNVPYRGWLMYRLATLHRETDQQLSDEWMLKASKHAEEYGLKLLQRKIDEFLATGDILGIGSDDTEKKRQKVNPVGLTVREVDVLREIAKGRTDAEIADTLYISTRTVSNHVSNILRKTGCGNRTEAARFAADRGLL